MPLCDQMYCDQKWAVCDTWYSTIGRKLRVAVVTTQYRFVKVITAQYRLVNVVKAQYRTLKLRIGG